jgi:integrase
MNYPPLTGRGKIQKKKNSSGKVYYQLIQFPVQYNDDGSIQYKSSECFKTKKEVEACRNDWVGKRKYALKTLTKTPVRNPLALPYLEEYIKNYVIPNFRTQASVKRVHLQLKKHIKPKLLGVRMSDVQPTLLQRIINDMNKTAAPKPVYLLLRRFFTWCYQQRIISSNPTDFITLPKHIVKEKQNRSPLSQQDMEKLLKYLFTSHNRVAKRHRHVVLILLYTGIRPSELAGMERKNVDLERGTAKIRKTVAGSVDHFCIRNLTKTQAGQRTVYLPPICCEAIRSFYERVPNSPWVFPKVTDPQTPCNAEALAKSLKIIARNAGIERPFFGYLFRHTFTTIAIRKGIPAVELKLLTGHKNTDMINKVYAAHEDGNVIKRYKGSLENLYNV